MNSYLVYSVKEVQANSMNEARSMINDTGTDSFCLVKIENHKLDDGQVIIEPLRSEIVHGQLLRLLLMSPTPDEILDDYQLMRKSCDDSKDGEVIGGVFIPPRSKSKWDREYERSYRKPPKTE